MSKKKSPKVSKPNFDTVRHEALLTTAQSLAIVHNLLNQGMFQGSARADLSKAIPFVEEMHKGVMVELEPLMEEKEQIDSEITAKAHAEAQDVEA